MTPTPIPRTLRTPRTRFVIVALVLFAALTGAAISYALEVIGVAPRRLAPYVEQRAAGHNPTIVAIGHWMGDTLRAADRGPAGTPRRLRLMIGAQTEAARNGAAAPVRKVQVASTVAAAAAFANALPGDDITFAPGRYRFTGAYLAANRPGAKGRPITVRSAEPGAVVLEFDMTEGFLVSAPYWSFENLTITGVCSEHSDCEHAFHITGNATNFIARNNTIADFNAHFKINGVGRQMPDNGLIEGNTLSNTTVRHTGNPVTIIDMVAASGWMIRKNFLADFIKEQGNQTSYGGFAKGAGSSNVFENNVVLCEYLLRGLPGQRVGLSLGDGGTGPQYCRDQKCMTEQDGSTIRGNLIAACSDDGIYINRSASSKLIHNTLIDTGGISIRFPESTADVEGNLVDGRIRLRDGAIVRDVDNMDTSSTRLFVGSHPVRRLFEDANGGSFIGKIPRRAKRENAAAAPDLCGTTATDPPAYGAFADFSACVIR